MMELRLAQRDQNNWVLVHEYTNATVDLKHTVAIEKNPN